MSMLDLEPLKQRAITIRVQRLLSLNRTSASIRVLVLSVDRGHESKRTINLNASQAIDSSCQQIYTCLRSLLNKSARGLIIAPETGNHVRARTKMRLKIYLQL